MLDLFWIAGIVLALVWLTCWAVAKFIVWMVER